jgi:site-specific recombinase XerD
MLSEKEINLVLGKDLNIREKKEDLSFRDWLTVKGIAPLTVKHTISYVNHMLRENNSPFPKREDSEKIGLKVLNSAYSKIYQKHLLTALELYMEYVGITIRFKKPKPTKRSPKYLTQEQLKKLIRGASDYRDFAMVIMFCTTGMRLNELRMLNVGDIDLERRLVTVRHAKRDRDREIPLSGDCVKVMGIFVEKYHKKSAKSSDPLFRSQRGNRWSAHAIESCVDRIAARAGMEGNGFPACITAFIRHDDYR